MWTGVTADARTVAVTVTLLVTGDFAGAGAYRELRSEEVGRHEKKTNAGGSKLR